MATSRLNCAVLTAAFSAMPAAIAAGSVCGVKRSTGAGGASLPGASPITRREAARDRRGRRKPPGVAPDHLAVGGPRALVVGLGGEQLGAPDVEAGLRL